MEELRKKVGLALKNQPRIDWADTKPPKQHAVHAMIKNLHAQTEKAPKLPKNST